MKAADAEAEEGTSSREQGATSENAILFKNSCTLCLRNDLEGLRDPRLHATLRNLF